MEETKFGTKELYDVYIKSTLPMRIGTRDIEEDETIIHFSKVDISTTDPITTRSAARGGWDNRPQIIWEYTRQVNFSLNQGVLSKTGWALISNSELEDTNGEAICLSYTEELESDEECKIVLKYKPIKLFIYDAKGKRINDYRLNDKIITLSEKYMTVIVNYQFIYNNKSERLNIGKRLLTGYVSLEGKIEIKDDIDGLEKTGILKIPRLILASDLSIRLGMSAQPYTGSFDMIGFPVGSRGASSVCSIEFLEDNLRSDL